jgi:hypothetical protein
MPCNEYNEIQRRCESNRRKMSDFMSYKPPHWQADPKTRTFAKDTQAEILKAAAQMATHEQSCSICKEYPTST